MKILKPAKLVKGDVIGFISPSSPVDDYERINRAVSYFERMGYRVELAPNLNKSSGYLAGTDEERRDDIHSMFSNKNVKAILCVRGGYGASRLLNKIDYNLIKKNPKIFCGYSDITILQNAIFKKTGLITFAGPMPAVDFYSETESYTEASFWNTLTSTEKLSVALPDDQKLYPLFKGSASGNIIGGNLCLFVTLLGTDYLPKPEESILFLEEVSESPYRIDRMFSHLLNTGYLSKLKGIVLGGFTDCIEKDLEKKSLNLGEIIDNYFCKELNIPAIYNYPHGHLAKNATLPIGIQAKIDADKCKISFLESPVV